MLRIVRQNSPGKFFNFPGIASTLCKHRAVAILQSESAPSAMLSGHATAWKNIDHRSWELGAHALTIASVVGWIAEAVATSGSHWVIRADRRRAVDQPSGRLGTTAPIISTAAAEITAGRANRGHQQTYHASVYENPVSR